MCSLVREERYTPFALRCPWLGKIRSCKSLVGCSCLNCLALFNFLVSGSLFHLLRNCPSFLLSCHISTARTGLHYFNELPGKWRSAIFYQEAVYSAKFRFNCRRLPWENGSWRTVTVSITLVLSFCGTFNLFYSA